jgi:hypothetical protein
MFEHEAGLSSAANVLGSRDELSLRGLRRSANSGGARCSARARTLPARRDSSLTVPPLQPKRGVAAILITVPSTALRFRGKSRSFQGGLAAGSTQRC